MLAYLYGVSSANDGLTSISSEDKQIRKITINKDFTHKEEFELIAVKELSYSLLDSTLLKIQVA